MGRGRGRGALLAIQRKTKMLIDGGQVVVAGGWQTKKENNALTQKKKTKHKHLM